MEPGLADELGVERREEQVPLLEDDGSPSCDASTRTPSPTASTTGARMNTPRTGCSMPSTSRSASNESTWRP